MKTHSLFVLSSALFLPLALRAGDIKINEADKAKLPPAATKPVDYARDIQPLLKKSCYKCHGPEKQKGKFRIDERDAALKGGEDGVSIVPGKSADSLAIHMVARLIKDEEMPPEDKGDPLTKEQIGLLRAWIDQGAKFQ
jgi:mono/diheme cytochrome c family protein